jgi:hypothetical protein
MYADKRTSERTHQKLGVAKWLQKTLCHFRCPWVHPSLVQLFSLSLSHSKEGKNGEREREIVRVRERERERDRENESERVTQRDVY